MVDPAVDFDALFAHDNLNSLAENTLALISAPDRGANVSRFTLQPENQLGMICGSIWRASSFDELISYMRGAGRQNSRLRGRSIARGMAVTDPDA